MFMKGSKNAAGNCSGQGSLPVKCSYLEEEMESFCIEIRC